MSAQADPVPAVGSRTRTAGRLVTDAGWVLTDVDGLLPTELYGILQLRSRVFVVEQACVYLDLDGVDILPGTVHIFLPAEATAPRPARDAHGGMAGFTVEPQAYARILPDGFADGPAARSGARSIGRVVTSSAARSRGLGHRLMAETVRVFGHGDLTLNAQSHLADFYGRHGFSVDGPAFMEDGIPHVPMYRPRTGAAVT